MDEWKKNAQGSEANDIFKRRHKQELPGSYYALDVDLILVSKFPPGVVAYLDYKKSADSVTFTEALYYNSRLTEAPVFIVESDDPEVGPFSIYRYLGGDTKPEPPDVQIELVDKFDDWAGFKIWEGVLRQEYIKRKDWRGFLKGSPNA